MSKIEAKPEQKPEVKPTKRYVVRVAPLKELIVESTSPEDARRDYFRAMGVTSTRNPVSVSEVL